MPDRTVDKRQSRFRRSAPDILDFVGMGHSFDFAIRAEFEIDRIGITYDLGCQFPADKIGEISANVASQRKLAVGKSART